MKKLLFALMALWATAVSAQYFAVDTLVLNTAYTKLQQMPTDSDVQWQFFNAFPSSWLDYINTYNYIDKPGYDLTMYHKHPDHCNAFKDLTAIPDSVYCKKLVNIAVGAMMGVDAPSALLDLERTALKEKREAMLAAITDMVTGDRMLYWQFFWSNHIFSNAIEKEFQELDGYMRTNGYADEADLMKVAYDHFHGKCNFDISFPHVGQRQYEGKDY